MHVDALTPGDLVTSLLHYSPQRHSRPRSESDGERLHLSTSKKTDCAPGKQVAVAVDGLQEMQNHFREQLDSGLKVLAEKQGNKGQAPRIPVPSPAKYPKYQRLRLTQLRPKSYKIQD
jgi:hypothetical protein